MAAALLLAPNSVVTPPHATSRRLLVSHVESEGSNDIVIRHTEYGYVGMIFRFDKSPGSDTRPLITHPCGTFEEAQRAAESLIHT